MAALEGGGSEREPGNLGERAQTRRLQAGIAAMLVALALAMALEYAGRNSLYRLVLFVPFFVAACCVSMGLFRTDVVLAARGLRDRGGGRGPERITSRAELAFVRRRSARVVVISVIAAAAATGLMVVAGR